MALLCGIVSIWSNNSWNWAQRTIKQRNPPSSLQSADSSTLTKELMFMASPPSLAGGWRGSAACEFFRWPIRLRLFGLCARLLQIGYLVLKARNLWELIPQV